MYAYVCVFLFACVCAYVCAGLLVCARVCVCVCGGLMQTGLQLREGLTLVQSLLYTCNSFLHSTLAHSSPTCEHDISNTHARMHAHTHARGDQGAGVAGATATAGSYYITSESSAFTVASLRRARKLSVTFCAEPRPLTLSATAARQLPSRSSGTRLVWKSALFLAAGLLLLSLMVNCELHWAHPLPPFYRLRMGS